jgi:hypothetical protein
MKVLFLDFDGVLNSNAFHRSSPPTDDAQVLLSPKRLDPEAIARVNRVIEATGAHIVVSSTWRVRLDTKEELQVLLEERGFTGKVIGLTPRIYSRPRGEEIQAWLDSRASLVERFAIVDDHDDMGALSPRLVLTDPEIGLTDADCEQIVALLSRA